MLELVAKHKSVLVLSSGRAVLWSRLIRDLKEQLNAGHIVLNPEGIWQQGLTWGQPHKDYNCDDFKRMISRCTYCSKTPEHQMCKSCLRKIRKWAAIPDRQWPQFKVDCATQTENTPEVQEEAPSLCCQM